jgi:hypothetical protein
MRVNVYAEELGTVELIQKGEFTGVRFWLYLPVTTVNGEQVSGPFMHHDNDDDSSAVTFWGKKDLKKLLQKALELLD